MEKEPKIGGSLEGDNAIPEFLEKDLEPKVLEDAQDKASELNLDKGAYLKESFNRHWIEIIQDHIDEFSEEERVLLDTVMGNLRENKRPVAYLGKKKQRFYEARTKLWQKIFGMKFNQWHKMWRSIEDKKKGIKESPETKPLSKVKRPDVLGENKAWESGSILEDEGIEEKNQEKAWLVIMLEAIGEFSPLMQILIDRVSKELPLSPEEKSLFDSERSKWWKDRFGMVFEMRNRTIKSISKKDKRRGDTLRITGNRKIKQMEQLHQAIRNLDNGEPVKEFGNEARRVIYYDEEKAQYYLGKVEEKRYLGVGDILSDYAWGVGYVPDGDMVEPAYRQIAKRILTNEARRNLEAIYDQELILQNKSSGTASRNLPGIEKRWIEGNWDQRKNSGIMGEIAETLIRELLNRISLNHHMDFSVMRATVEEDTEYKYDFKIRVYDKNRGVKLEEGPEVKSKIIKIGFQLKTHLRENSYVRSSISRKDTSKYPIDSIVRLTVNSKEIGQVYDGWLGAGKPSGGPEQFLSRDLKVKLLEEVTKGLVEISDKDIGRIFPLEESKGKTEQAV